MELEQKKKNIMFYETCRLCLDEHGHCDIFERDGLSEDIHRCIGVKVKLSDNLPQRICKTCLDIVEKATKLSVTAKKNEHHLKILFCDEEQEPKDTGQEPIENVTSTHFGEENSCYEKHSAIENFLKVRMDLFDSSVAEDTLMTSKGDCNQPDSSQKSDKSKKPDRSSENICSICSKKFDTYRKMYHHSRLHNKNYVCPLDACGKRFSTKGDIAKHLRTHTGEKPFHCDLCDKSFAQRVTLRSHKESLHNGS
ncbi:myoneurin-like [Pararge aegeria]|uniref:Jg19709 protein n=2 Tax=Pararge aegeria TaxID=116150 RepID=A0A8S4R625_9NEOP|nr:myoneurin-like [Pararge aegeria]CAH2229576.1 jg19709 [Pararge aegeria aegeria]